MRVRSYLSCGLILPMALVLINLGGCPRMDPGDDDGNNNNNATANQNANTSANGNANTGGGNTNANNSTGNGNANGNNNGTLSVNAGADQTVEDGASVTLAGTGSDSAGAAVTFLWTQASGAAVTIQNAGTATASFTSPPVTGALEFNLEVRSASASVSDRVVVQVNAAPILFVANFGGQSVLSFRASSALSGNVAPRTAIVGANTRLQGPTDMLLDKAGGLLVSNADGQRVVGFLDGLNVTGDVNPNRILPNPDALFQSPQGLAYVPADDLLLVANFDGFPETAVRMYSGASSPLFGSPAAPTRSILSLGIRNPRSIFLTSGNELYCANAGSQTISVFAAASTLSGSQNPPSRTIMSADFGQVQGVAVDAGNRLYVTDTANKCVHVFDGADLLNNSVTSPRKIFITGAQALTGIALDQFGRGYVADPTVSAVYVIENIAGATGTMPANRQIVGALTQLASPANLRIVNR